MCVSTQLNATSASLSLNCDLDNPSSDGAMSLPLFCVKMKAIVHDLYANYEARDISGFTTDCI